MENKLFSLASELVEFTSSHLFLTGKAGTGKTTFLKHVRENTHKNTVVVAPTGVAAINAGGVTMHSFFQLPFIPFLPDRRFDSHYVNFTDRNSLFKGLRFSKEKLGLMRELELLIIDEVSMLRADMLDAMDEILRHVREKRNEPFGGVQVLFIGDLYQLPPVVKDEEWSLMKDYYTSPFFFSAKVLEKYPPLFIELKTVYRQSDEQFIRLLNNIRNNTLSAEDRLLLQQRVSRKPVSNAGSITLTTHNHIADTINQRELRALPGTMHRFSGTISGNFPEKNLPAEMELYLKEGAQVMFVKNDSSGEKRYFNGKIATVTSIREGEITVVFREGNEELKLEKEKWKSVQYAHNKEAGLIEEEETGSYEQYPVRLAWAITIHKSQGLTFDHAVIDAGQSFASGQVYVALSRCRTLDGIQLLSDITPESLHCDDRIISFSKKENSETDLREILRTEKPKYAAKVIVRAFSMEKVHREIVDFFEETKTKNLPDKAQVMGITGKMIESSSHLAEAAGKFTGHLQQRLAEVPVNETLLREKVPAAKTHFSSKVKEMLLDPLEQLRAQLAGRSRVRQYLRTLTELESMLWKKIKDIERATFGDMHFEVAELQRKQEVTLARPKKKAVKGESQRESLELYRKGLKVEEIAKQRGFALTTIEGHLAQFVRSGEINVFDFLGETELEKIKKLVLVHGFDKLTPLKEALGESVSYGQLRMAVNYLLPGKKDSLPA